MRPWLRRRIPDFVPLAVLVAWLGFLVYVLQRVGGGPPGLASFEVPVAIVGVQAFLVWAVFGNGALFLIGLTRAGALRRAGERLGLRVAWSLRGPRLRGRIGEISVDIGQY